MARPLRHWLGSTRTLLLLLIGLGLLVWTRRRGHASTTRLASSGVSSQAEPVTANAKSARPAVNQPRAYRSRLVAVGDLHGDLEHALRVLRMARVVDGYGKWIASNTILVQTGDIVDRGRDTIALYRLFQDLSIKGHVVNLVGNHEVRRAIATDV